MRLPIVEIKMWAGRTEEQKERLVKEITEAVTRALGVEPEETQVIIIEIPKSNWGVSGRLASKT